MTKIADARVARIVTIISFIVGVVFGEAIILAIVAASRHWVPTLVLQWLVATTVVAIGGYLVFGLPQIKAWERSDGNDVKDSDFRTKASIWILRYNRWWSLVIASTIGGPFAVGFATGYSRSDTARLQTFIAAWILAVVWVSIYLGVIGLIFN